MKKPTCLVVKILLILIGLNMIGCKSETSEFAFMDMISTKNLNHYIQLRPLPARKQVFDGRTIILELANVSNQLIKFPADYGIRLFIFDQEVKQWEVIPNLTEYEIVVSEGQTLVENDYVDSQGRIKLHPFGSPFEKPETDSIFAEPDLDGLQRPIILRIVVQGMVRLNEDEEEKVAAYYDIYIDQ